MHLTKKAFYFLYLLSCIILICFVSIGYLYNLKTLNNYKINQKKAFVKLVGLPDLAISTEASYIRHRSLSDIFSIYKDDGSLREYFPSSFIYNSSLLFQKNPARIEYVKK